MNDVRLLCNHQLKWTAKRIGNSVFLEVGEHTGQPVINATLCARPSAQQALWTGHCSWQLRGGAHGQLTALVAVAQHFPKLTVVFGKQPVGVVLGTVDAFAVLIHTVFDFALQHIYQL